MHYTGAVCIFAPRYNRSVNNPKVIVIGGGPGGILAAGTAAQHGAQVILLEKGPKLGRKLRISGKGRCNITNTAEIQAFVDAFAPNGKFLYSAFSQYFRDHLLKFLNHIGIQTKVERGGRVFPASDSAIEVADALENWLNSCGVNIKFNTRVKSIVLEKGKAVGVELYGTKLDADAVILATGGASYPKTGSSGDGYAMAKELGHTIIPPKPALSALVTGEHWVTELKGLSLKNVEASLVSVVGSAKPKVIAKEFGEMLFTHFGISGPIILTLSRKVPSILEQGKAYVSIDLKPALTPEQLHARFIRDFTQTQHFKNYLPELLPKSMAEPFLKITNISPDKPLNKITAIERTQIVETLKGLRLSIRGMRPIDEAIVTAGGVSIKEVDPKTMMSKLVPALFFAGEVLDIDAETGGYNLQAAFSTGYVAGKSAANFGEK